MKQLLFSIAVCLVALNTLAQAPDRMSYQMVIRNSSNVIIANQNVGIRISILKGTATGTAVFSEIHTPATNANGLVSFAIGTGSNVSGTFAGIDWGNGPYFIQTEVDPLGGTNYTITGTSQFLSVPYALYATSTGSSHLIITGNMTNAQAADKIAAEAGPNTKFVWIQHSKKLTSVNLTGVRNVIEVVIQDNDSLQSVTLPDLATIDDRILITDNKALTTLSLAKLTTVSGAFNIENNQSIPSVTFPSLVSTSYNLTIASNASITSVSFPTLTNVANNLSINSNPVINSITLPALQETKKISITDNSGLTNLLFPALQTAGYLVISNPKLTTISAPSLAVIGSDIVGSTENGLVLEKNSSLNSISFPVLKSAANLAIYQSTTLTSIAFPALTDVKGSVSILSNPNLTSLSFPVLKTVNGSAGFSQNTILPSLSLPALTTIGNVMSIYSNSALTSISMSFINIIGSLDVSDNRQLTSLSLPFTNVGGNTLVRSNTILNSVNFPSLVKISGNLEIGQNAYGTTVSLPAITSIGGDFNMPTYNAVTVPVLTYVGGNISFAGGTSFVAAGSSLSFPELISAGDVSITTASLSMPKLIRARNFLLFVDNILSLQVLDTCGHFRLNAKTLTSLSLPQLHAVKGDLEIAGPQLASLSLPSLNSLGVSNSAPSYINLFQNKFPGSQGDALVNLLVNITPQLVSKQIRITATSPFSAQSQADIATLRSRGNVVNLY